MKSIAIVAALFAALFVVVGQAEATVFDQVCGVQQQVVGGYGQQVQFVQQPVYRQRQVVQRQFVRQPVFRQQRQRVFVQQQPQVIIQQRRGLLGGGFGDVGRLLLLRSILR